MILYVPSVVQRDSSRKSCGIDGKWGIAEKSFIEVFVLMHLCKLFYGLIYKFPYISVDINLFFPNAHLGFSLIAAGPN